MKILSRFALGIFLLLFAANIVMYVKSLGLSSNIKRLEEEIEVLQSEIDKLQEEALAKESLYNVASQAAELGFVNIGKVLRVDTSKVAFKE